MDNIKPEVHSCMWAANGEVQIRCSQEWAYVCIGKSSGKIVVASISSEHNKYVKFSFCEELVTCAKCKSGVKNVHRNTL